MNPQQIQAQVDQVNNEISDLRTELGVAMAQNADLRTMASNNAVLTLARRLQGAENLREQLLIHRDSIAAQLQGYSDPSIGVGFGPGPQGGVALAPGAFGASSYSASSPRGYDPDATPRPRHATLQPPQQQNQQQAQVPQQQQQQQQQQALATTGSKHNANYLPMVIENTLYEHMQHKNKGTLRTW
jgi:hypothetical protein